MSLITLKPLDDGQKAVEIPLGKTTIGRGPFLGCSDKKVSRNHAVLEVTNKGEVYLTPTHVNPCFYQPTADSPGQILKKDVPYKLENGDSFSLLPRAYRYQLIVESEPNQNESTNEISNKESGKTNGSAVDLHEGVTSNEELGDTIVPEKVFIKEDASNTEKNCVKEENNFSKKISEIKDNGEHDFTKDIQEKKTGEFVERTPSKGNDAMETDIPVLSDKCKDNEELNDKDTKSDVPVVRTGVNDLSDVDSRDPDLSDQASGVNRSSAQTFPKGHTTQEPPADVDTDERPVDKIVDENDSTLNVESNSKNTVLEGEEKSSVEMKLSLKNFDEKEESHADVEPDAISEDQSSKETELQSDKTSTTKITRKEKTIRQPKKERQAPKRKAASESPAKPRGRKKANKINFDGNEESTSQRPGRTSSRTNRQTRQGLSLEDFIVSDDDEWQSDRSEPKPRRKRGNRRGEDSGSDWEVEHKKPKKPLLKVLSGSESGSERGNQRKRKGLKGKRKKDSLNDEPSEVLSEEEEPQASSSNKDKINKPRNPCKYGKKCYRRHPNHRNQFSHPGDSDYTSETETNQRNNDAISESDGESPKKECPYGVNCFRKNPQHKKDFKHTKKVRPQREAAKQADKKAKSSRNSDEVDNYDLNDSFLNDDSDEYKPVDSGSDYESGEKMKKLTKGVKSKRGKKA